MIKVETIRTIYKELFILTFIHPGYESDNGSDLWSKVSVEPDNDTIVLFRRLGIDYRCVNDSIICFIRCELVSPPAKEPKKPFTTIDENFRIRLLLKAQPNFLYNTYVTAAGSKVVYYFTNRINNIQSGKNHLSKSLEVYNSANDFDEGTVVSHGGEPYASLKPVKAADSINISNAVYWKKVLPGEQVVNNADLANVSLVEPHTSCIAVIDIFNSGTTNASYELFGPGDQLKSPVYTISFKSKI